MLTPLYSVTQSLPPMVDNSKLSESNFVYICQECLDMEKGIIKYATTHSVNPFLQEMYPEHEDLEIGHYCEDCYVKIASDI